MMLLALGAKWGNPNPGTVFLMVSGD